jgi:hypothetical protein
MVWVILQLILCASMLPRSAMALPLPPTALDPGPVSPPEKHADGPPEEKEQQHPEDNSVFKAAEFSFVHGAFLQVPLGRTIRHADAKTNRG